MGLSPLGQTQTILGLFSLGAETDNSKKLKQFSLIMTNYQLIEGFLSVPSSNLAFVVNLDLPFSVF